VAQVPGQATVEVDIRLLPGQDWDYVLSQLKRAVGRKVLEDKVRSAGTNTQPPWRGD
jgi:acetylornithine deacetylase/succinyl-diaminopimelate desuccinylase-like protein